MDHIMALTPNLTARYFTADSVTEARWHFHGWTHDYAFWCRITDKEWSFIVEHARKGRQADRGKASNLVEETLFGVAEDCVARILYQNLTTTIIEVSGFYDVHAYVFALQLEVAEEMVKIAQLENSNAPEPTEITVGLEPPF